MIYIGAVCADFTQSSLSPANIRSVASNNLGKLGRRGTLGFAHRLLQVLRQIGVVEPDGFIAQIGKISPERRKLGDGVCRVHIGC